MPFNNETKNDFINLSNDFIDWMVTRLCNNDGQLHSWISSGNWHIGLNREQVWECTDLFDAYEKYYWGTHNPINNERISSYNESASILENLSGNLHESLANNNNDTLTHCNMVLKWGGVYNYSNIATTIRSKIPETLVPEYLNQCKNALNNITQLNNNPITVTINNHEYDLQLDSGTTKIFSLIANEFIMYDSRVGAALAMLVKKWALEEREEIPDALKFSWQGNLNRNPNINDDCVRNNIFPNFAGTQSRISYNIAANWLCKEILVRGKKQYPDSCFYQLEENKQLRGLEAALFMIGYKTNNCQYSIDTNTKTVNETTISIPIDGWITEKTIKGKTFQWCINNRQLKIITGKQSTPGISLSNTEIAALLAFISQKDYVILGNSRTKSPIDDDFDRTIGWNFLRNNGKPQLYASHVMVVLLSASIVDKNTNHRAARFAIPDPRTAEDLYRYYEDNIESP